AFSINRDETLDLSLRLPDTDTGSAQARTMTRVEEDLLLTVDDDNSTAPALQVAGLSARYGRSITALRDVSLTVGDGEVVTLMGLNGAGKSTLARAVTGLLPAQGGSIVAGSITSFGVSLNRRSPRAI